MSLYKNNPVTLIELEQWRKNKLINPRSNRKIKTASPIYKYLDEESTKIIAQDSTIIVDEMMVDEIIVDEIMVDEIIVDEDHISSPYNSSSNSSSLSSLNNQKNVENDSVINDSVINDSVINDSVINDSVINDSVINDSVINDSVINDSVINDPVINDSVINDPVINDSVINDSVINDNQEILNLLKNVQGPLEGKYINSLDNKDPISQEDIWELRDGEKKALNDIPLYKMFSYRDKEGNIRCFNIESMQTMIQNNINKHPITGDNIEKDVIDRALHMIDILINNKILKNDIEDDGILTEKKIKEYAFDVFQKFSFISIFIDSEWFLKLQTHELLKLNYELKDFYENNVETNLRKIMVPPNGIAFELTKEDLASKTYNNILEIQKYILENVEKVIGTSSDDAMKNLGNYLMIGGLAIVCPEIRERYPDFVYGFSF
jgi:hypothetical protein